MTNREKRKIAEMILDKPLQRAWNQWGCVYD